MPQLMAWADCRARRLNDSSVWRLRDKHMRASRRCLLHAAGNAGNRH